MRSILVYPEYNHKYGVASVTKSAYLDCTSSYICSKKDIVVAAQVLLFIARQLANYIASKKRLR